ncbi:magoh, partial [Symbiodinium pilosum]
RDPIRLDVKSVGRGRFVCGHYDLDLVESSEDRIVWADVRNRGKTSVWKRRGRRDASRSRSRGRNGIPRVKVVPALEAPPGGTWSAGYGLPSPAAYWAQAAPWQEPRSAVATGTTPGAWVPPRMEEVETIQSLTPLTMPAPEST